MYIHNSMFMYTSTHFVFLTDPREWTEEHVIYWLNWAKNEFSLVSMNLDPFYKMKGRAMVDLGKEKFLAITPPFTGDILWEHLDILQKGECASRST